MSDLHGELRLTYADTSWPMVWVGLHDILQSLQMQDQIPTSEGDHGPQSVLGGILCLLVRKATHSKAK